MIRKIIFQNFWSNLESEPLYLAFKAVEKRWSSPVHFTFFLEQLFYRTPVKGCPYY